jgi:hypothetical protein
MRGSGGFCRFQTTLLSGQRREDRKVLDGSIASLLQCLVFPTLPHVVPDLTFTPLQVEGGDRDLEHLEAAVGRGADAAGAPRDEGDAAHATFLASANLAWANRPRRHE